MNNGSLLKQMPLSDSDSSSSAKVVRPWSGTLRLVALFLIWLFATLINLDKAYHIDDTVHLETAQWILQHPLRPMSGLITWDQSPGPIHLLNQPHLYFYLLAIWGHLWGFGEISMHILQSLFALSCIILAYRISVIIAPSRALLLTALLTLSPAFIVGQNIMVDIPLLFAWLTFYYTLITPKLKSDKIRFILAGIVAGLACLIKYTSLALIPSLLLYIVCRKQYKNLWIVGVPLGIIAIWSVFNYYDYGGIHILGRQSGGIQIVQVLRMSKNYLICLGGMMPYSFLFFYSAWHDLDRKSKIGPIVSIIFLLAFAALIVVLVYSGKLSAFTAELFLAGLFLVNGIGIIIMLIIRFRRDFPQLLSEKSKKLLSLYLWTISGILFIVLFAPFIASRHILLVIMPITILLGQTINGRASYFINALALLVTGLLGMSLGISDRMWANFYRVNAGLIRQKLPPGSNVYFAGHWGWQWYAKQNGMKQLDALNPGLRKGDYLAYPLGIHQQSLENLPKDLTLVEVGRYTDSPSIFKFFSTRGHGGGGAAFYSSGASPPWTISWFPVKPILVYRLEDVAK